MPQPSQNQNSEQDMVISYLTIRKAVGYLGFFFPVVLFLGTWLIGSCPCLRDSISSYYYTVMVTYFAGTLCAVGLFLFTYKGYDKTDQLLSRLGALFVLGIIFFPTDSTGTCACCNVIARQHHPFIDTAHYVSAGAFFITMAAISLFLFTKTDPNAPPTDRKIMRNGIYKACAYIMIVAMIMIPCLKIPAIPRSFFNYRPEFWLESTILMAFGFSWLTKGEALLKDK